MIVRVLATAAVGAALLVAAGPASAKEQPRDYACPYGRVLSVVRWNEIKPTGSVAGFQQAVRDNLQWYRDHGLSEDQIAAYPVQSKDRSSRPSFVLVHRDVTEVTIDQHDAAWAAYVAAYSANASIKEEKLVCLPRDERSTAPATIAFLPPIQRTVLGSSLGLLTRDQ